MAYLNYHWAEKIRGMVKNGRSVREITQILKNNSKFRQASGLPFDAITESFVTETLIPEASHKKD